MKRVFGGRPKISQAHVARRAATVIDTVIFDMGIDTLVGGTFVLEKSFRLRFSGAPVVPGRGILASIRVGDIAEAKLFREIGHAAPDSATMKANGACLAHALVREFGSLSPAFRALPARET